MQQSMRKIKRVQPLIRMKKAKVDEEAAVLEAIRKKKLEIVSTMKENQRRYMEGVEQLNAVRASRGRSNLTTLEGSLDYVKAEWYRLYKMVQDVEAQERSQIEQVLFAERELKSVEKLQERYQVELTQEMKKQEQKTLDEIALRNFTHR
jgi:flagellar export protein FliJ